MSGVVASEARVEELCGDLASIHAPRGTTLNARSWQTEAPLRMLLNNLDPEVAEHPERLVVYGGSGKAARSHAPERSAWATPLSVRRQKELWRSRRRRSIESSPARSRRRASFPSLSPWRTRMTSKGISTARRV